MGGSVRVTKRRFSKRERVALWLAADGKCESCGVELSEGWHADHVHPWSRGGETDVVNGAALCARCNLKKSNKTEREQPMTDPREQWQTEAVANFVKRTDDFLVTATPGAGKTRMALRASQQLLDKRTVERVIVVVPTLNLRKQWSKAAAAAGLDLTAMYENGAGALTAAKHGVVVTYQQVDANPDLWRRHSTSRRTLAIFDEIHHAGDESSWGESLKHAFGMTHRRLMLSGTPFRTDNRPIPFVRYDENGMSISDAGIDLRTAVANGVVRSVKFDVLDGEATIDYGHHVRTTMISESDDYERNTVWRCLREPSNDWIPSAMRKADAELSRVRKYMPNAAGIVYAASIEHAREYAKLMGQISGERADVVHSESEVDPNGIIEEFARGSQRWLVSVKMVSEGVDIPRAIVGVYASDVKTEMWFRQVVGRHVRKMEGDRGQIAKLFIPDHAELREIADRIQDEANVRVREEEIETRDESPAEVVSESPMVDFLASSEAVTSCVIFDGQTIGGSEIERAEKLIRETGLFHLEVADVAMIQRATMSQSPEFNLVSQSPSASKKVLTPDQQREMLRQKLNDKVARLSTMRRKKEGKSKKEHGPFAAKVNGQLKQDFCVSRQEANADQLQEMIARVNQWIDEESQPSVVLRYVR